MPKLGAVNAATKAAMRGAIGTHGIRTAASFGATGGEGINAGPIINAALAQSDVTELHLGPLTHYFSGSILVPPGKRLVGSGRGLTWLKYIPATIGTQAQPVQAIHFLNDTLGGEACDFSLDIQRSGLGGGNNDRVSGVTISSTSGNTGKGTRVRRVDVYNATGYAHYDSTGGTGKLRDLLREDCKAINSQVGFESTGDTESTSIDTHVDCSTTTWDGGALVPCESMYHEYGNILHVRRVRAKGYGQAGAGMFPVTVGATNIRRVTYEFADIEMTSANTALVALGQAGQVIERIDLIECRFTSANALAALFTNATAIIRGGEYTGAKLAANGNGNGVGIGVSTGAVVDLFAPIVVGNSNPAGGGAAVGLNVEGTGVARWHGAGKITASGPQYLMLPTNGTVSFHTGPIRSPA